MSAKPRKRRLPRSDPVEADPSDPRQLALDLGPPGQAPGASDDPPMGRRDDDGYNGLDQR